MAEHPAQAALSERPLSPHLQIYRWPVTMLTSILHRASGVALGAGLLLVTFVLIATAYGRDHFTLAHDLLAAWFGRIVLLGFTLALAYHLLNGIRHLCWDAGWGFGLKTARGSGLLVFAGTIVLTLLAWTLAYWMAGAWR